MEGVPAVCQGEAAVGPASAAGQVSGAAATRTPLACLSARAGVHHGAGGSAAGLAAADTCVLQPTRQQRQAQPGAACRPWQSSRHTSIAGRISHHTRSISTATAWTLLLCLCCGNILLLSAGGAQALQQQEQQQQQQPQVHQAEEPGPSISASAAANTRGDALLADKVATTPESFDAWLRRSGVVGLDDAVRVSMGHFAAGELSPRSSGSSDNGSSKQQLAAAAPEAAEGGRCALLALKQAKKGDIILTIPFSSTLMLSPEHPEPYSGSGPELALLALLLREFHRGNISFWQPYLRVIPRKLPLPWLSLPPGLFRLLHHGPSIRRVEQLLSYFEQVHVSSDASVIGGAGFRTFLWGLAVLYTRHFTVPLPSSANERHHLFVPIAECLLPSSWEHGAQMGKKGANSSSAPEHDTGLRPAPPPSPNVEWQVGVNNDQLELISTTSIAAGDQLVEASFVASSTAIEQSLLFLGHVPSTFTAQRVTLFESLEEAVWWFIRRCISTSSCALSVKPHAGGDGGEGLRGGEGAGEHASATAARLGSDPWLFMRMLQLARDAYHATLTLATQRSANQAAAAATAAAAAGGAGIGGEDAAAAAAAATTGNAAGGRGDAAAAAMEEDAVVELVEAEEGGVWQEDLYDPAAGGSGGGWYYANTAGYAREATLQPSPAAISIGLRWRGSDPIVAAFAAMHSSVTRQANTAASTTSAAPDPAGQQGAKADGHELQQVAREYAYSALRHRCAEILASFSTSDYDDRALLSRQERWSPAYCAAARTSGAWHVKQMEVEAAEQDDAGVCCRPGVGCEAVRQAIVYRLRVKELLRALTEADAPLLVHTLGGESAR